MLAILALMPNLNDFKSFIMNAYNCLQGEPREHIKKQFNKIMLQTHIETHIKLYSLLHSSKCCKLKFEQMFDIKQLMNAIEVYSNKFNIIEPSLLKKTLIIKPTSSARENKKLIKLKNKLILSVLRKTNTQNRNKMNELYSLLISMNNIDMNDTFVTNIKELLEAFRTEDLKKGERINDNGSHSEKTILTDNLINELIKKYLPAGDYTHKFNTHYFNSDGNDLGEADLLIFNTAGILVLVGELKAKFIDITAAAIQGTKRVTLDTRFKLMNSPLEQEYIKDKNLNDTFITTKRNAVIDCPVIVLITVLSNTQFYINMESELFKKFTKMYSIEMLMNRIEDTEYINSVLETFKAKYSVETFYTAEQCLEEFNVEIVDCR
jgi:hypothetical protein